MKGYLLLVRRSGLNCVFWDGVSQSVAIAFGVRSNFDLTVPLAEEEDLISDHG
jgi:hypothetical protein